MECVPVFVVEVTFVELADEVPEARLQPHQTCGSIGAQFAFVGGDCVREEYTGIVETSHFVWGYLSDYAPKVRRAGLPYYTGVYCIFVFAFFSFNTCT